MMRIAFLTSLICAAFAMVSGCGGSSGGGQLQTSTPYVDQIRAPKPTGEQALAPTPTLSPTVDPGIRQCRADDLYAFWAGTNGLTGGQIIGGVVLINKSATGCRLDGLPEIEFLTTGGGAAGIAVRGCGTDSCASSAVLLEAGVEFVPHQATSGTAGFQIIWPTHEGDGSCDVPPPQATELVLRFEGDSSALGVIVQAPTEAINIAPCGNDVSVTPLTAAS